jgi:hypothetical protein
VKKDMLPPLMKKVKSCVKSPTPVTVTARSSSMSRQSRGNSRGSSLRKLKTPTALKSLELVKTDVILTNEGPIIDIRAPSPRIVCNEEEPSPRIIEADTNPVCENLVIQVS